MFRKFVSLNGLNDKNDKNDRKRQIIVQKVTFFIQISLSSYISSFSLHQVNESGDILILDILDRRTTSFNYLV